MVVCVAISYSVRYYRIINCLAPGPWSMLRLERNKISYTHCMRCQDGLRGRSHRSGKGRRARPGRGKRASARIALSLILSMDRQDLGRGPTRVHSSVRRSLPSYSAFSPSACLLINSSKREPTCSPRVARSATSATPASSRTIPSGIGHGERSRS